MADDGSGQATAAWPQAKFRFEVTWNGGGMHAEEVSGLDVQTQPIEYRRGDSPKFTVLKMPGIRKFGDVTLKRGILKNDSAVWAWLNGVETNTVTRKTVTIRLLDEAGAPTMVWTLADAWPTRITGADSGSQGSEVAVESIVFSHGGLTVAST